MYILQFCVSARKLWQSTNYIMQFFFNVLTKVSLMYALAQNHSIVRTIPWFLCTLSELFSSIFTDLTQIWDDASFGITWATFLSLFTSLTTCQYWVTISHLLISGCHFEYSYEVVFLSSDVQNIVFVVAHSGESFRQGLTFISQRLRTLITMQVVH